MDNTTTTAFSTQLFQRNYARHSPDITLNITVNYIVMIFEILKKIL